MSITALTDHSLKGRSAAHASNVSAARRWVVHCLWPAALLVGTYASAQTASDQEPQGASAAQSAPSPGALIHSVGSFFSKFAPAATQNAPGDAPPASQADASSSAPAHDNGSGSAFNVIDITSWSKTADVVLDPQCKTLVQPFGMTDSAASLGMLALKLKVNGLFDSLQGKSQGTPSMASVIRLAARNLNWLPTDLELRLGEKLIPDADILDEDKNKDSKYAYEQARAVLADIVAELPKSLPYQFKVLVRTTSYGNATALPGGIILVDRDLFKKDTSLDYAYFVMSHEVAHVLQRHETRAYQARLADGVDTIENFCQFLKRMNQPDPSAMLGYATALKKLFVEFSEQQELQADSCAVRIIATRHPDPRELANVLRSIEEKLGPAVQLAAEGPKSVQVTDQLKYLGNGVLERHPESAQRRTNLLAAFRSAEERKKK